MTNWVLIFYNNIKIIFLLFLLFPVCSCTIDYKPKGHWVENSTNDTLIMEMNVCDTISNGLEWIYNSSDSTLSSIDDTISGNILGKKTVFYKYYYVKPASKSGALFQDFDTCYLYVIKSKTLNKYSIEEILRNKMYDERILTKKDFHDHEYKYR